MAGEKIDAEEILRALKDVGRTERQLHTDVEVGERIARSEKELAVALAAAESHKRRRDELDLELGAAIKEFEASIAERRKELQTASHSYEKSADLGSGLEATLASLRARESHLENEVLHPERIVVNALAGYSA